MEGLEHDEIMWNHCTGKVSSLNGFQCHWVKVVSAERVEFALSNGYPT